jgi:hypothetical protein
MSDRPGFSHVTLSIPTALKLRMDNLKSGADWSSFVSDAIERKLDILENRPAEANIADAAERLRASKRKTEGKGMAGGIAAGKDWAAKYAEHRQLVTLAAANASLAADPSVRDFAGLIGTLNEGDELAVSERLAEMIQGKEVSRSEAREFWELALGYELIECRLSADFMAGFNEGALAVWQSVKDKL